MPESTPPFDAQSLAGIREAKSASVERMMTLPNISAVGIGYKNADRGNRDAVCLVVGVTHKLPLNALREADRIPSAILGVMTDVVETGAFTAWGAQVQRLRPARPGLSIGLAGEPSAGTFGCLVQRDGRRFVLSNNHVIGKSNQAPLGSVVVQPAVLDGGGRDDRIGRLAEFIPIAFEGDPAPKPAGQRTRAARATGRPVNAPGRNRVDCALVAPDNEALIAPEVLGIGAPQGAGLPGLGTRVQKSGRTSGCTRGEIVQVDVSVKVDFAGRTAVFVDQAMAGAMSADGDSGSAVLNMQEQVVGLLFAGSATYTLINPIQFVLSALRAELVPANPR